MACTPSAPPVGAGRKPAGSVAAVQLCLVGSVTQAQERQGATTAQLQLLEAAENVMVGKARQGWKAFLSVLHCLNVCMRLPARRKPPSISLKYAPRESVSISSTQVRHPASNAMQRSSVRRSGTAAASGGDACQAPARAAEPTTTRGALLSSPSSRASRAYSVSIRVLVLLRLQRAEDRLGQRQERGGAQRPCREGDAQGGVLRQGTA